MLVFWGEFCCFELFDFLLNSFHSSDCFIVEIEPWNCLGSVDVSGCSVELVGSGSGCCHGIVDVLVISEYNVVGELFSILVEMVSNCDALFLQPLCEFF